jgi:hypothetical protein
VEAGSGEEGGLIERAARRQEFRTRNSERADEPGRRADRACPVSKQLVADWYFGSIYRLVGLIDYKRPYFRLIAWAIELSWRPEGNRLNRGALYHVFIL